MTSMVDFYYTLTVFFLSSYSSTIYLHYPYFLCSMYSTPDLALGVLVAADVLDTVVKPAHAYEIGAYLE